MKEKQNYFITYYEIRRRIYTIRNNKKDGEYKVYRKNGQLQRICNYKNGKIEGAIY